MKRFSNRFSFFISYHFKQKKTFYIWFFISLFIGVILGIVLHFTSNFGGYLLSDSDQQIFDFITKDISAFDFFLSKVFDFIIAFCVVFLCCLSIYSSFLVYVFFAYQGMIFGSICCQIISLYGILGIVNVFILLIPINIILFCFLFFEGAVCMSRASLAKKYNIDFKNSFYYERYFFKQIIFDLIFAFCFLFFVTLIMLVALRSISFVAY